jgi:predicted nucleotidyltransferase
MPHYFVPVHCLVSFINRGRARRDGKLASKNRTFHGAVASARRQCDVDVLVEFEAQAADSFSNFLDLKESLEALFQRSVDLVELQAIRNRRLRYYIEQSKSSIYAAA